MRTCACIYQLICVYDHVYVHVYMYLCVIIGMWSTCIPSRLCAIVCLLRDEDGPSFLLIVALDRPPRLISAPTEFNTLLTALLLTTGGPRNSRPFSKPSPCMEVARASRARPRATMSEESDQVRRRFLNQRAKVARLLQGIAPYADITGAGAFMLSEYS